MKVKKKKQATLSKFSVGEFLNAGIVAVLTPVLVYLAKSIGIVGLNFDWGTVGTMALSAFVVYLGTRFGTPTEIVVIPETELDNKTIQKLDSTETPKFN